MRARSKARVAFVCATSAALFVLGGCASRKPPPVDVGPTLKTLADRQVVIKTDQQVAGGPDKTIAAYQEFLKAAPRDSLRPEAMRRLGDLEMDRADQRIADGDGKPVTTAAEYRAAITLYQDHLKAYPTDPGNDRVLYQLARAHELGGDPETALATLTKLVQQFPKTRYYDEAQFRRGELMFTARRYADAEKAYASLLGRVVPTPFEERALYMQGWTQFKQTRLDDALKAFFGVLDLKLVGRDGPEGLDTVMGLTRADRELVEDTFRVTSLSLENLQGAESIPPLINSPTRREYEFRVYEQLGELYLKQERIKDAADTFGAFARRHPQHARAPQLQARVIDIYEKGGFANLALQSKKDYVDRYGAASEYRKANPLAWERTQPLLKTHLTELATQFHAAAQKSKKTEDYQEAAKWYRGFIDTFPRDPQAAASNFLLAELLFEDKRFDQAAAEYEKSAYGYPVHPRSADAGYAALLSYAEQEKRGAAGPQLKSLQTAGVDSALRFARAFPNDARAGAVLSNAAERLYALQDTERAAGVAQQVLDLTPPAAPAQRRIASVIIANTAFERGAFDRAEQGYREVLALTPEKDPRAGDINERLAASIYKQGEQARADNRLRDAAGHFERVAAIAPQSAVRATAQFDAAAVLIGLKDWDGAARTLEDFRRRFPTHPLQADVSAKLAVAYTEKGQWAQAAGEFDRIAVTQTDPRLAREALWQSAELFEKAGSSAPAAQAYERYVKQYRDPYGAAVEARWRLAQLAKRDGNAARAQSWMREVFLADQAGGGARTDRTRYLGATAALALAEPARDEFRKVALVEPLQKQLKLKKAKMEEALKAYGVAAEYGVADVATAATFQIADVYGEFGRAMLDSQRPKGLKPAELEQYNVLLEEQAFPFEEKAIELHEINARRSANGIYDEWVKRSYAALAKLRPVRYGKGERSEVAVDAIR